MAEELLRDWVFPVTSETLYCTTTTTIARNKRTGELLPDRNMSWLYFISQLASEADHDFCCLL